MEKVSIESITPEDAKLYLSFNTMNRNISSARVAFYLQQMIDGHWRLTNDAIIFADDGTLLNGQHRLLALTKFDKPQKFIIGTGFPKDTIIVMDTGKARTSADAMKISEIPNSSAVASIVKRYYLLTQKNTAITTSGGGPKTNVNAKLGNQKIIDIYNENAELYQDIAKISDSLYGQIRLLTKTEIGGYMIYLLLEKKKDMDKVLKFFSGIISTTQSESKTLETLRVRLLRDSTNTLKMPATVKQKLIIKAWNYFDKGKEVQSLVYDQNRDDEIWFE